jgi:hypothetical protein
MMQIRLAVAACAVVIASTAALSAQKSPEQQQMVDGRWRGWIQQADEDSIRVTYDVQHSGKHILITMNGRSGITYDMAGVKLKDDVLTFDWSTGVNSFLYCRLSRRDGATFEGVCDDHSPGMSGKPVHLWMIMSPPGTKGS